MRHNLKDAKFLLLLVLLLLITSSMCFTQKRVDINATLSNPGVNNGRWSLDSINMAVFGKYSSLYKIGDNEVYFPEIGLKYTPKKLIFLPNKRLLINKNIFNSKTKVSGIMKILDSLSIYYVAIVKGSKQDTLRIRGISEKMPFGLEIVALSLNKYFNNDIIKGFRNDSEGSRKKIISICNSWVVRQLKYEISEFEQEQPPVVGDFYLEESYHLSILRGLIESKNYAKCVHLADSLLPILKNRNVLENVKYAKAISLVSLRDYIKAFILYTSMLQNKELSEAVIPELMELYLINNQFESAINLKNKYYNTIKDDNTRAVIALQDYIAKYALGRNIEKEENLKNSFQYLRFLNREWSFLLLEKWLKKNKKFSLKEYQKITGVVAKLSNSYSEYGALDYSSDGVFVKRPKN